MKTSVQPLRFLSWWQANDEHREALGINESSVQGHVIVRLLLRLHPDALPSELRLQPVPQNAQPGFRMLSAGQPLPRSLDSCRRTLDEMDCEAACTERVQALRSRRGGTEPAASAESLMQTCRPACEEQKQRVWASLERRLEAVPERQQQAWRWVEEMTGMPAATWQSR